MNEDCRQLREKLLDWADRRASAADAARVEAHVDACAPCRALAGPLRREGPPVMRVDVPDALVLAVRESVDRRLDALEPAPAAEPGWFAWLFAGDLTVPKPLAWGAVAMLVVFWSGRAPLEPVGGVGAPSSPSAPPPVRVLMDGVDLWRATPAPSRSS